MREPEARARARRRDGFEARALGGRRVGRPQASAELDVEDAGAAEAGGGVGEDEVRRRAEREALEPEGLVFCFVDRLRRAIPMPGAVVRGDAVLLRARGRRRPIGRRRAGVRGGPARAPRRRARAAQARGCPGGAASGRRAAGAAARRPRRSAPRPRCRA